MVIASTFFTFFYGLCSNFFRISEFWTFKILKIWRLFLLPSKKVLPSHVFWASYETALQKLINQRREILNISNLKIYQEIGLTGRTCLSACQLSVFLSFFSLEILGWVGLNIVGTWRVPVKPLLRFRSNPGRFHVSLLLCQFGYLPVHLELDKVQI